eukprot:NODE_847_length_3554_cov_0.525036.p3 type:complete len:176 gc:universal NODE_847_length_3554_cov_0.525036:2065-1538(-)
MPQIDKISQTLGRLKVNRVQRPKNASVMILLCNEPLSILYTVRADTLKNHAGQISFPGGKQDPTDLSLLQTAIRETEEEIGLSDIKILGEFYQVPAKSSDTKVSTFVGYKPFIDTNELRLNKQEVSQVFLAPIGELAMMKTKRLSTFCYKSHVIWGLTGYLTKKFIDEIYLKSKL